MVLTRRLVPQFSELQLWEDGVSTISRHRDAVDVAVSRRRRSTQATQPGADLTAPTARTRVACGASSYHGPASTSPGGGIPLGAAAKGLTHAVRYPVPSPFLRYREESDAEFHERLLAEFIAYLDTYEHELGVVLVEPQWGSSVASTPWPPQLLRAYVTEAKRRGFWQNNYPNPFLLAKCLPSWPPSPEIRTARAKFTDFFTF